jgi:cytidylate kinase
MPNLIVIFGPQASGKMTIAQKLAKGTGYGLIHSHMIIDIMDSMFGYGTKAFHQGRIDATDYLIRSSFSNNMSLILTRTFNFADKNDHTYLEMLKGVARDHAVSLYLVELDSNLSVRLYRNRTENRLKYKPSKHDIELSEQRLIETSKSFIYSIPENRKKGLHYIYIENSFIEVEEVSDIILEYVTSEGGA